MPTRSFPLEPAPIHVCDEVLDDLRRRLTATEWPLDTGTTTSTSPLTTAAGISSRGRSLPSGSRTYGVPSADDAETDAEH